MGAGTCSEGGGLGRVRVGGGGRRRSRAFRYLLSEGLCTIDGEASSRGSRTGRARGEQIPTKPLFLLRPTTQEDRQFTEAPYDDRQFTQANSHTLKLP